MAQSIPPSVVGIVLAAGSGSRLGRPKAEVTVDGVRLLDRAVIAARDGGCQRIIAVVREGTRAPTVPTEPTLQVVVNPDPDRGMRSSLALGVAAATAEGMPPAALAVLLVDMPGIGPTAVRTVVARWRPGRICIGTYDGRRGHPIVMAPQLWQDALAVAAPDEGARRYLSEHAEIVDEVAVPGDPADLDTPTDLQRWSGG
jgi:molybdenum cofactor cytidylyltransferase/nicotine blue oxidoreductase